MVTQYFSVPGFYRIEVQGRLPSIWSDRFGDMQIFSPSLGLCNKVTFLQGKVIDQAELTGILNNLYELHLPLLSVQYLGGEQPILDAEVN